MYSTAEKIVDAPTTSAQPYNITDGTSIEKLQQAKIIITYINCIVVLSLLEKSGLNSRWIDKNLHKHTTNKMAISLKMTIALNIGGITSSHPSTK